MGLRRRARQRTLQLLYAMEFDMAGQPFAQIERRFLHALTGPRSGYGQFARQLTQMVHEHSKELDEAITPHLRQWTLDRLLAVDRIILRMALAEMRYFEAIPLRVTIDEAIELAHAFSDDESPQFINAVLDQLGKSFQHKDFKASPNPAAIAGGDEAEDADFDFEGAADPDILSSIENPPTEGRGESTR